MVCPPADLHRQPPADGWLEGTTQDGRRIGGPVSLGHVEDGPRRGREVLAELHGDGPLVEAPRSLTSPSPAQERVVGAVGFEPTTSCSQSTCAAVAPRPDQGT